MHCHGLSFTTYYSHIKAHQDDRELFSKLSRKAQLNCICDHAAKQRIAADGMEAATPCRMSPLEPIGLFVRGQKMTSETGDHISFWAHHQLAWQYYRNYKLLSFKQFNLVDWKSIHQTLHNLSRLFQLWAEKHILGIAGMMKFLAYQDNRSPLCPSCLVCNKTCKHVAWCPEAGHAAAFAQSTQDVKRWLADHHTQPNLKLLLLHYLRGRGTTTCLKCSDYLNLPHIFRDFAVSQDVIGWDGFTTGMVSTKLLPIQNAFSHSSRSSSNATWWISGLITQLLQVMHTQWIYWCVLVHDCMTGTSISVHKEELLKEVEHQLNIGADGLNEQDWFLLECNFDELATTAGEHQEYWLLAIQAAREASRIRTGQADKVQQCTVGTEQRQAFV